MASRPLKRARTTDGEVSPPPVKRQVAATTTNRAVSNFFKPASQKEAEDFTFNVLHGTLLVGRYEGAAAAARARAKPVKVAAFDFDDTLIKTKSGNVFARGADDWQWWHASVPGRLRQLHADGYVVVVVSNQSGISLKSDPKGGAKKSLGNFKEKVAAVFTTLALPVTLYAGTERDLYRKPRTGMWEQMLKDYGLEAAEDGGEEVVVDRANSIFVGDAAGRAEDRAARRRKDHSTADRDFAANVGIGFQTPEEYFLGEEPKPFERTLDPRDYLETSTTTATMTTTTTTDSETGADAIAVFTKKHDLEIVVFCGSPGAGKSTFFWQHLQPLGYERVNQDTLKTRDRCLKAATQMVEAGKSVAVDNTNADVATRAVWVGLAAKLEVPIRLVYFTAPSKLCDHNDTVRALSGGLMNPENRIILPRMAFTGYASRFQAPSAKEGFEDITEIDFVFRGTEEEKRLWSRYWISA